MPAHGHPSDHPQVEVRGHRRVGEKHEQVFAVGLRLAHDRSIRDGRVEVEGGRGIATRAHGWPCQLGESLGHPMHGMTLSHVAAQQSFVGATRGMGAEDHQGIRSAG